MSRLARGWHHPDRLAILFLVGWPLIYFWQVTLGQGVWYSADIQRIYLPFGTELSRALGSGRLPFWTTGILTGFPLLAEGHVAALYPIYLLLFRLLPPPFAISYGMLLHLAWGACGMYACLRALQFRAPSALLAGFLYSFNAFAIEKVYYTPILVTSAWLPWLIFLQTRFRSARRAHRLSAGMWLALAAAAFGLQLVSGFPQMAFMSAIAFGCFGLAGELFEDRQDGAKSGATVAGRIRDLSAAVLWTVLPLFLGGGMAAIQLLPTLELIGYSVRSGGMGYEFVTSYSLPPAFLTELVVPFSQAEPFEHTNGNLAYLGLAPLVLAIVAPFVKRDRRTLFYALFTLGALSLTLGDLNPLYVILYRIPIFDLFRTPARYLFLYVFGAIFLAATGFEFVLARLDSSARPGRHVLIVLLPFVLLTAVVLWLAQTQAMDFWLKTWRVLPLVLALATAGILGLAWKRRIDAHVFAALAIGLIVFDLSAYAPPVVTTPGIIQSPAYVEATPRSLSVLKEGRVLTDLNDVPTIPALRGSLYPNTALTYDHESVQANSPLAFARHEQYLANLSAPMLDLLHVRYLLVPLEPRAIERVMGVDTRWTLDAVENPPEFPAVSTRSVELVSFTEQSNQLARGTQIAQLAVQFDDGTQQNFPIRSGIDTADWDSARQAVEGDARPDAPVAHTLTGFLRSSGSVFEGRAYRSRYDLGSSRQVVGIAVESLNAAARLAIEQISLVDERGAAVPVSKLTNKSTLKIIYMSDTVAVWENQDVLPQAFVAHTALVASDATALEQMRQGDWQPDRVVYLEDGASIPDASATPPDQDQVSITAYQPERVEISAKTSRAGYLVLTDSWYPGWEASVDGRQVDIRRADLLFRAVEVGPGEHTVVMTYHPRMFLLGAILTVASLIVTAGIGLATSRLAERTVG